VSELRDRAHGNDPAGAKPSTEVERTEQKFRETNALIRNMEKQFALAAPKGMEAAQLVRDAMTVVRQNPKLLNCTPQSLLGALMTCAQLGLRPGVLGQAYVVPFYDKSSRSYNAQLIVGYPGLAALAYRSDQIASITARVVYSNDLFLVRYGTADELIHEPRASGDRGEAIGYYCVVHIKGGRPIFEYMTKSDMEKHRDKFAMQKNKDGDIFGPWVDDFDAMGKKTCLRKLANWIPRSTELQTGLMADEGFRVDTSGSAAETTWHAEQVPVGADGNEPPKEEDAT
jgi:recombination protein RecT